MAAPASTSPNFAASSVKMFSLVTTGRKKILKFFFIFFLPEKVVRWRIAFVAQQSKDSSSFRVAKFWKSAGSFNF